jgi:hypothetical protein
MAKKIKAAEPSLRDRLSESFLRAFDADFEVYGVDTIKQLREKNPEKYCELGGRLIVAAEQPSSDPYANVRTASDIGRKLLEQVGTPAEAVTEEAIAAAVQANETLVNALLQIKARSLNGGME